MKYYYLNIKTVSFFYNSYNRNLQYLEFQFYLVSQKKNTVKQSCHTVCLTYGIYVFLQVSAQFDPVWTENIAFSRSGSSS